MPFPSSLLRDLEEVIKVFSFDYNVLLAQQNIQNVDNLIHATEAAVFLEGELSTIPDRICFNQPQADKEKLLTDLQKGILNCIYLGHCKVFVSQRHLEQLIDSIKYFLIPYSDQLLGSM